MMNNMTDTVKQLLIINILFFIGSYFVPQANELLSLHYFESDGFKFWQPITHMFMHGSPMHIFFNMFGIFHILLYEVSNLLSARFILIFFIISLI